MARCPWCGTDPLYVAYHDDEWGVPSHDDRHLFEMLVLEGAQAGLSWITILRKREAYRRAFDGFNPEKIRKFEKLGVPVDIYAVGSSLFNNNGSTVTDFTSDVVRVKIHGEWIDMAKVGRKPLDNPNLERVW